MLLPSSSLEFQRIFRSPPAPGPSLLTARSQRDAIGAFDQRMGKRIASVKSCPSTILSTPGTSVYRLSYKQVLRVVPQPPRIAYILTEPMKFRMWREDAAGSRGWEAPRHSHVVLTPFLLLLQRIAHAVVLGETGSARHSAWAPAGK